MNIEPRQQELDALILKFWPNDFNPKPETPLPPQRPTDLHDQDIIEKALSANDGGKFRRLWEGYATDYPSPSEADMALACKLAFWTGRDPERIDTLFRQSGLMRDKWDRDDYRERTIARAIELTSEVYTGRNTTTAEVTSAPCTKPPSAGEPTENIIEAKVENSLRPAVLESEDFISKEMPQKTMYLDPWLSALSIILITGARGIGKSWFLLSLLLAITKFKSFGPWAPVTSVPCLYLDGEMAAQDAQERLVALDQDGEKKSPLYVYSDAYASSQGLPRANLLNPAWRKDMKSLLFDLGVKVWAVDNIASLTPGIDENSKQEWDPINQWLLELRFNEITTIPAHHTNRSGGQRGTSGREDNIDISILLKQPEGYTAEDGASFIASFTKARIAIPHLSKIADTAFQMQQDKAGKTVWTWGGVKQQRNQQIITLHLEGVSNKDIAAELGCTKQNVGQVIRRYEKDQK
jgi:hypothetical protein